MAAKTVVPVGSSRGDLRSWFAANLIVGRPSAARRVRCLVDITVAPPPAVSGEGADAISMSMLTAAQRVRRGLDSGRWAHETAGIDHGTALGAFPATAG